MPYSWNMHIYWGNAKRTNKSKSTECYMRSGQREPRKSSITMVTLDDYMDEMLIS